MRKSVDNVVWLAEQTRVMKTRYGWKSWDYVIDTRRYFGHIGRYPRPVAKFIATVASEFTGKDYGTCSRSLYLDNVHFWENVAQKSH